MSEAITIKQNKQQRTKRISTSTCTIVLLMVAIPLCVIVCWQLLLALGVQPATGYFAFHAEYLLGLFDQPALYSSTVLSIGCATLTTLLAMSIVLLLVSFAPPDEVLKRYRVWILLLLSTPHLAFVVGWQFVIAPSGFIARVIAQITGADIPSPIASTPDPWFIGYIVMLAMKESGFLLMLVLINLPQIGAQNYYRSGVALGYTPASTWRKVLVPMLYPRIRLGVYAMFVYAATNVEVALFAAPNLPELMSLRVFTWYHHADLGFQHLAASGAIWLIGMVALSLCIWRVAEKIVGWIIHMRRCNNHRGSFVNTVFASQIVRLFFIGCYCLPLVVLAFWSVSQSWVFPDLIAEQFSLQWWTRNQTILPMLVTLIIACISACIALLCAIVYAENVSRAIPFWHQIVLYAPLLTPQLTFAAGFAILANFFHINGTYLAVMLGHLFLILPYTVLILTPIWQRYDYRYTRVALVLGRHPVTIWWKVKFPLLVRPVLFCLALGMGVSVSLYLPTLLIGEGRIVTLMSEMVGLGASYDRRQLGVFSLWLTLIPLSAFLIANLGTKNVASQLRSANHTI